MKNNDLVSIAQFDLVIAATTSNVKPFIPEWAKDIQPVAQHVSETGFRTTDVQLDEPVIVVGTGITAVQITIAAASRSREVILLLQEPLRRADVGVAPLAGSIPAEVYDQLVSLRRRGAIKVKNVQVKSAIKVSDKYAALFGENKNRVLGVASRIVLTT